MASQLASNTGQFRCVKCSKYASVEYIGEFGVRYSCSCARASSGCWTLPKDDVL